MSEFTGTARFTVRQRLGSGGMGVVYLAHDRERGVDVALKTLARVDARGIAGLKNEFRALADIAHPNLVALDELFCEDGLWFFTMEVVEGASFLDHVCSRVARAGHGISTVVATTDVTLSGSVAAASLLPAPTSPLLDEATLRANAPERSPTLRKVRGKDAVPRPAIEEGVPAPAGLACDLSRLRPALRQLAEAVAALHAAGTLHRDLKPSNVLVTRAGRVVILDFGLAAIHGERRVEPSAGLRLIEGTPAYMAPEQTLGEAATPASDWYAVGVMLYEALTGRLPFVGDIRQMLAQKRVAPPAPPSAVVAGSVPEDLSELAVELLRIKPDQRPSGAEVLRRLGVPTRAPSAGDASPVPPPFVGRDAQLAELRAAFASMRTGRAVAVHLHGRSGMGKSALVEHFLDEVWRTEGALVLSGRCYERESVPYKAWDSLVDALVRHLCRLSYDDTSGLVPADIHDLARVFPVLHEVEIVDERTERFEAAPTEGERVESRRRAVEALKELLQRLAAHRPLVLHLDDLQWGDVDSAKLMTSVLSPPDAPPLLLLCSYRSEEAEGSEFFRELYGLGAAARGLEAPTRIEVGRLSPPESEALARSLLLQEGSSTWSGAHDALVATIAAEAEGSPFFVAELVRSIAEQGATSATSLARSFTGISLEGVLRARIDRVPPEARRLLEILSVAARPIEQGTCARAAALDSADAALGALRAAHLIRSRGLRPRDLAEPDHDRIRELVVRGLDAEALREAHRRLAVALEDDGADAEVLAAHYEGAGDGELAARYAVRAAEGAMAALAFDRAARLYRLALSLGGAATDRHALGLAIAGALASAGRGAEAAPLLLEAAERAPAAEALDLRRRAAEQFLLTGHIDRGAGVLRAVLASVGVAYPESTVRATLSFVARQAHLRVRGTRFDERRAGDIDPAELARIDACFTAGKGLAFVDPVRGLGFHAQHLLLSLAAGDPVRVCLGLSFHAVTVCLGGGAGHARARGYLAQASAIAERLGDPYLLGVVGNCTAATHMCLGRWRATVEEVARANAILRRSCSGATWEIEGGIVFSEVSLLWMGRLGELVSFVESHARAALDRGDLFAATYARMHTWYAHIAADDPPRARAEMREAISRWSRGGFHIMHFWALYGESAYDLYAGDARGARTRLLARWPELARSNILRVQFHRVWMTLLRGGAAIGAALTARGSERADLLREAERDAAGLTGEGTPYSIPAASLLRAGVLAARGRREAALPDLEAAAAGFGAADMALHAACARRRKGEIVGGDEGRKLVAEADVAMTAQGIARPDRWATMVAPGF